MKKTTTKKTTEKKATKAAAPVRRRVQFTKHAPVGATVFLAGSFNGWMPDVKQLIDKDGTGEFTGIVLLAPGVYEYKFVIDGVWYNDENNSAISIDPMGNYNNVIEVK